MHPSAAGADCADTWTAGPAGSGLQYRPCLYHRTDNPNLWNPGIIARNISSKTSLPQSVHIRLLSVTSGSSKHTVIADQELAIPTLGPTNPYSISAPYQRWPSQETKICLVLQAWGAAVGNGERSPASAPSRAQNGQPCEI